MSNPARLMAGITLLTVPTIVFGGLTVLGALDEREGGPPHISRVEPDAVRACIGQGMLTLAHWSSSRSWSRCSSTTRGCRRR